MDEIIRAVRDCPSGALGFAIDGVEAREQIDWEGRRDPAIEVSKDGPYRITGGIPLNDHHGESVTRAEGSSLEHYALCRCGHSQNKPFCSGMHWSIEFKDPVPEPDREPTLFEWCGGLPALTRMTRIFYEKHVPEDPLLAPLFATMSPDHPVRVARWLGEVFGGAKLYSETYGGYNRMISQHLGKGLTEEKRARWVELICLSAQEAGLPSDPEFQAAFRSYIEWGSRIAVENSQTGAKPPPDMPMPRWWWACDATPGSRVSALAGDEGDASVAVELPGIRRGGRVRPAHQAPVPRARPNLDEVRARPVELRRRPGQRRGDPRARQGRNDAVRRSLVARVGGGVRAVDRDGHERVTGPLHEAGRPRGVTRQGVDSDRVEVQGGVAWAHRALVRARHQCSRSVGPWVRASRWGGREPPTGW